MWYPWRRTPTTPPPTQPQHPSPRQSARHRPGRPRQRTPRILRTQSNPLVVRLPPNDPKVDWAQRLTAIGTVISSLSVLALGAGLYYTNQDNREQRQLQIQAQASDRLAKDVEQLGSSQLATTLGGIYGLERLMNDSPDDQHTVVDILAAYVRDTSRKRSKQTVPTSPEKLRAWTPMPPNTQLQAALTVLGRQPINDDYYWEVGLAPVDLTGADLTGADLTDATLTHADLRDANLTGADLTDANLTDANLTHGNLTHATMVGANMPNADLTDATLTYADLTGTYITMLDENGVPVPIGENPPVGVDLAHVDLTGADLTGADLTDADLRDTTLTGARLRDAHLTGADLTGATLTGVDLRDAHLTDADLAGAVTDRYTKLPAGVTVPPAPSPEVFHVP